MRAAIVGSTQTSMMRSTVSGRVTRTTARPPAAKLFTHLQPRDELACRRDRVFLIADADAFTGRRLAETIGMLPRLLLRKPPRRIETRIEDYLRFATDPNTSFDNNAVEREISMVELGTAARIGDVDDERVLVGGVCDPTGD